MRFLLAAWAAARATSQAPTLNASSLLNATAAPSSQRHCALRTIKVNSPKTYGNRAALGDALRLCEAEEKCIGVYRQCECRSDICTDYASDCCAPGSEPRGCSMAGDEVESDPYGASGPCVSTYGQQSVYQCCKCSDDEAEEWVRCKSAGKDHCGREKFDPVADDYEIYTCEAYEERPKMMSAAV